jgi:hypothetical protein
LRIWNRDSVKFTARFAFVKEFYLNAVGGNDVAEAVVVVTQELGEIVQQNQKHTQCSLVEKCNGLVQLCVPQEWRQEFEQVDQQLSIHSPALENIKTQTLAIVKKIHPTK